MVAAFRARLGGGAAIIVNVDHPSASLAGFLARLPIDAIFIDCEQGSADVETVEHMARAARLERRVSLVRIFNPEDWVIERYLGRGVDGIVVPRLDSAAAAARVVETVRYCYPEQHEDKIVVIQIETAATLDRLDDFLALDGIDAYFLGPVDLAKIAQAGKTAGMLVTAADADRYVRCGARFLYIHANDFLAAGAQHLASRIAAVTTS